MGPKVLRRNQSSVLTKQILQSEVNNFMKLDKQLKIDLRSQLSVVADSGQVEVWVVKPDVLDLMPPHI